MTPRPEEEHGPLIQHHNHRYGSNNDENDDSDSCDENDNEELFLTMDDALERLGYGPFQNRILWAAGLCFAADGMEMLLLSFLTLVLTNSNIDDNNSDLQLTPRQASSITASVFAGALVGTCVLSCLGDRWGRKPVFQGTAAMIALFGMGTSLAPDYLTLLFTRFGVGFGVGGLTVPFDVLVELLPAQKRGHNLLVIEYFWTAGTMMVVLLAYLTLGEKEIQEESSSGARELLEGWLEPARHLLVSPLSI